MRITDIDSGIEETPRHPDRQRLGDAVLRSDTAGESSRFKAARIASGMDGDGLSASRLFGRLVDQDSLSDVMHIRINKALDFYRNGEFDIEGDTEDHLAAKQFMRAMWLDAFTIGYHFCALGGHRDGTA